MVQRLTAAVLLAVAGAAAAKSPDAALYKSPAAPIEARVQDLLRRMTLEEKIAQLTVRSSTHMLDGARLPMKDGKLDESKIERVLQGKCYGLLEGSFGGDINIMPAIINAAQRYCIERTRLGIPMIPYIETLHGVMFHGATIYPQSIGMGSTWNPGLIQQAATEIADEASAAGIRQALAPTVDVIRDQRWGRVEEAYGEDPHHVSRLSVAYVLGLQGPRAQSIIGIDQRHIGAMCKVFIGHGFPERGINLAPVLIP